MIFIITKFPYLHTRNPCKYNSLYTLKSTPSQEKILELTKSLKGKILVTEGDALHD